MVRSSVAAFYPLLEMPFLQRLDAFTAADSLIVFLRLPVRSEVKKIVHWMPEILFAAEIAFRGLDRCMPEQN